MMLTIIVSIVKERLSPRLRIPLEKEFFQSKIIDNEGSDDLLNRDNFNLFIKGLMISAYDFSDDLMLILDYTNAKIKINYEYDEYDTNDTTDDTSDDTIEKKKSVFEINLQV